MSDHSKIIKGDNVDKEVSLETRLDMEDASKSSLVEGKKIISKSDLLSIKKANSIVEKAMSDANKIRTKAKEIYLQVEQKMEEARQRGYENGCEEGKATVTEMLTQIQMQHEEMISHIEKEALKIIDEIAQKIIGEQIKTSDEALFGLVRQAMLSSMGNKLTVYLNPVDFARVKEKESELMACLDTMQTMNIKVAENVKPDGCVVESELGTIDAQLHIQLAAIKRALGLYDQES